MTLDAVRIRTLPVAAGPIETAVEASLKSLEWASTALHGHPSNEDQQEWGTLVLEMEEASRVLRARVRHLDRDSPFRATAEIAVELLGNVAMADDGVTPSGLARELAEWTRMCAAREIAYSLRNARDQLGRISLREAARRSGLAAGHLSELEAGGANLPTASTARRLDDALGTDVTGILARVRGALLQNAASRRRRPALVHSQEVIPTIAVDPRLDALFARIAGDERLIRLIEDMLRLPPGARRGIAQMVRALVPDGAAGR